MKIIISESTWKNIVKLCEFDSWKKLMMFRREFIINKPIDMDKIKEITWKYKPFI